MAGLEYLPVEKIVPTKDNPRKINKKDPGIGELAKSIKGTNGVVQAVIVRPHPTKKGFYELRAGERRLTATKLAGFDTIKAEVWPEMDDEQARVITAVENLEREDLTPLEEARGIKLLMKSEELEEVANRLGKNVQWVHRRAQLMNLSAKWKKFIDKDEFGQVKVGHMELIARYEKKIQDELYDANVNKWCGFTYGDRPLKDFKKELDEYFRVMSKARWSLDDADLYPTAGACSKCTKRSSYVPMLFDEDTSKKTRDQCLDRGCWDKKMAAWIIQKYQEHAANGKVLVLHHGNLDRDDHGIIETVGELGTVSFAKPWNYVNCKKSDKGAVMAMEFEYNGYPSGQFKWVRPSKDGAPVSDSKTTATGPDAKLKAALERLKGKRAAAAIDRLKEVIHKVGDYPCQLNTAPELDGWKKYFTGKILAPVQFLMKAVAVANIYGADINKYIDNRSGKAVKTISSIDESNIEDINSLAVELWQYVTPNVMRDLFYETKTSAIPRLVEAERISNVYNFDFKKILEDIEMIVPAPKWVQKELTAREAKKEK